MGETADGSRTDAADAGDSPDAPFDLLAVALAAYATHLDQHARVRVPGPATPWGRSARLASLRRFTR